MQGPPTPTEVNEASVPTENVRDSPNLNDAVAVRRTAAKRTLPWDLAAQELLLIPSSSLPRAEDIPAAKKKPRIEEPLPTTTDEVARKPASSDVSVGLPPPAEADDDNDTNVDRVMDTQPNAGAARATSRWTLEEDAELTHAVANTSKKKHGKEYQIDWVAVASLVPGRTKTQCCKRWYDTLNPSIDRATGRTGTWTEDEDIKLKGAVQTHGVKNWCAITALVPGRTKNQCKRRWNDNLDPSIDRENGRTGKWTEGEDSKLKDAVQTHGGKNWAAISALVPGRTEKQCNSRWKDFLDPSIDRANQRTGSWTSEEDDTLKDAVQTHGGKDWAAIAALVPGRTKMQCYKRWKDFLDPSINRVAGCTGKWTEDENIKLKDAVQAHGGKNWCSIAALVPGRTKTQCCGRWKDVLDASIDRENGRTGKWTEDEDLLLKDAVQAHGGKNWAAISALVPGRTEKQCYSRWQNTLNPSIALTPALTGKWAEDENIKLKDAVQTHGGKDWAAIAALVPGRTKMQCSNRWKDVWIPTLSERQDVRVAGHQKKTTR
jgi:hypothetical protein